MSVSVGSTVSRTGLSALRSFDAPAADSFNDAVCEPGAKLSEPLRRIVLVFCVTTRLPCLRFCLAVGAGIVTTKLALAGVFVDKVTFNPCLSTVLSDCLLDENWTLNGRGLIVTDWLVLVTSPRLPVTVKVTV